MTYELTQVEKILVNLARSGKEWNKAHDLIGGGDTFIGYEVTARLTNATDKYPQAIERRTEGKYKLARLRIEASAEWLPTLPKALREIVEEALAGSKKHYKKRVVAYEPTPEGTMRQVIKLVDL